MHPHPCPHFQVIKLGDLGIAKQLEPSLELAITCLGTPYYSERAEWRGVMGRTGVDRVPAC